MAVKVDKVATLFLTGILGISAGALTVNYILDKKNVRDLNTKSEEAKKQYYGSMTSEDKASKAKAESQKAVTFLNKLFKDTEVLAQ